MGGVWSSPSWDKNGHTNTGESFHIFFLFCEEDTDATMAHKRIYTPLQALALLNAMDDCDSDGGEELCFSAEDSDLALSTGADTSGQSDEENRSPPRKKRSVAKDVSKPATNINAKDGTAWEKTDVVRSLGHGSTTFTFSETAGPTEHAKRRITSRLQSFLCLIDIEMLRTITHCTVHEAHRADQSWNLSVSELMAFIAVLFLQAILCPVGAVADCWSKKYAVPAIKDTMSRDRYKEIMRYLRFDDKDTRAERVKSDRFAAISDIWQCFVRNCTLCYTPGQHINTVDEQLFPTKVRCPFLQYIATKPDKFGIKFWIAADLKTKYMCNALPYLGKDPSRPKGERLSENVVMKLMEPYLDKGRTEKTMAKKQRPPPAPGKTTQCQAMAVLSQMRKLRKNNCSRSQLRVSRLQTWIQTDSRCARDDGVTWFWVVPDKSVPVHSHKRLPGGEDGRREWQALLICSPCFEDNFAIHRLTEIETC
ncbi:uncharacterized protein LOC143483243 [Brachyhypopomus gauderio]|uniref:uncharacterized protein LOC143482542 n=1 Tax=Brachyhypopomus gauderio TaxID=698409 RepID=UPI004042F51E